MTNLQLTTNNSALLVAAGINTGDPFTVSVLGIQSTSVPAKVSTSPSDDGNKALNALQTALFVREQHQIGSKLNTYHGLSSSADPLPTSSYGSGKSSDHSPVRAALRRRADRDREKQLDDRAAPKPDARMSYVTGEAHPPAQQIPPAGSRTAASNTSQRSRNGSQSNASSFPAALAHKPASRGSPKSRRSPRAIINADSIRSSSPRSYTPKGTPPRVPRGSLHRRNTTERQNNSQPLRPLITTTASSPPLSSPSSPMICSSSQVRRTVMKADSSPQDVKSKAAGTRAQSRLQENTLPGSPSSHLLPTSPAVVTYSNNDHDNSRRKDVVDRKSIEHAEHHFANQPSTLSKSNRRNTARFRTATRDQGSQRDHSQQQQREKAKTKDPADLSQIANTNDTSSVLAAVEGLRADTRDAIIGLHIDLIKTSRSHKVSLHFPSVRN